MKTKCFRKSSYTHVSPTPVDVNDDTTVTSNNGNNSDSIHTTEQAVSSSTPSPARRNNQVNENRIRSWLILFV